MNRPRKGAGSVSRSISLCVRKSTPLQTPEITPFFAFAIYNFYFPNIFANVLTFTNTYAIIRTDKTKGDANMDSRTYYYARVSSKEDRIIIMKNNSFVKA